MLDSVSSYEAKTRLPALLRRVEKGETIKITRHGIEVAQLVPTENQRLARVAAAVARIRARRKKHKPTMTVEEIKNLIHEGHKW